jgi:hypothetical protein
MKFEYKVVRVPGGQRMTEDMLNDLGTDGYELVHVNAPGSEWVFKRQKRATRSTTKTK